VRGAASNGRPYRDTLSKPCMGLLKSSIYFTPLSTSFILVSLFDSESRFFAPTHTC
jgi:hypothetical protein